MAEKMKLRNCFLFNGLQLFLSTLIFTLIILSKTTTSQSSSSTAALRNSTTTIPVNVGVVLAMESWIGKMGFSCVSMALSDFYGSHHDYRTRLVLHLRDSMTDALGAAAAALDLLKNVQVKAIVGPTTSMDANFIIGLGNKTQVPIMSFSATSPSLTSIHSHYFVRASQNDSSQVKPIAAVIKFFGFREAVPVYIDNEFGEGIIPFLNDALQEINVRVPYRSIIPPVTTDDHIRAELYKLISMQSRVFIVHMPRSLGSRLFTMAKNIGMMNEGYVWITTDAITNELGTMNSSVIESMQGTIGVRPYVPRSTELEKLMNRWKTKFQRDNPTILNPEFSIVGLWAYDAATALAMAVEKLAAVKNYKMTSSFKNATKTSSGLGSNSNSTDLATLGVSQDGPTLLRVLLSTRFTGLAGNFQIADGQLQPIAYEIVNVIGSGGGRNIGYWTTNNGISRRLLTGRQAGNNLNFSEKDNLGTVIWPGDTTTIPKGWVIPTDGKKLKIGVPVKDGFSEFVRVVKNPEKNTTTVTGYCIDVFNAVMQGIPYVYEYVPFALSDGEPAGTYDELVNQVYLGNYDAVVGDVTIISYRATTMDFSLPFSESGVSMVVPIKDENTKNAWVFLKPLTWQLWVSSFCAFVIIGIVIWGLEHRINKDFRGPASHQIGMIFWFSFSTMVFAHREKVVSNFARLVVIIWVFVVLILTQSYTASLTSMLTVEQLRPTITDIKELVKGGDYVGYQEGSFVADLLKKMNFDEKKLRIYHSPEECDDLLMKGSQNGGISAAIDEIPYMRLFIAKYCSKYAMVQPIYKTAGFGFVFPKGSPLVPDVSRAVLNVTEGDRMIQIENEWLAQSTSCPISSTSSASLGFESFSALFAIAIFSSLACLIVHIAIFSRKHWPIVNRTNPSASIGERIMMLGRRFNKKDLSSHTFRKKKNDDDEDEDEDENEGNEKRNNDQGNAAAAADVTFACPNCTTSIEPAIERLLTSNLGASPGSNCPPSPFSSTNGTEASNFAIAEEGTNLPPPSSSSSNSSSSSTSSSHRTSNSIQHEQQETQEMVPSIRFADLNQNEDESTTIQHS